MRFHIIHSGKALALALATALSATVHAQTTGPIKVFFIAGQSNAQGHGFITEQSGGVEVQGTLRHFVDNNPGFGFLRPAGNWVVRNDTWMWVRQGPVGTPDSDTYSTGDLTAGFGAGTNNGPTSWAIGPEFGFGMEVGDYLTEQVVIVKTAWGGTSLVGDWRPPSAVAKRGGVVGLYYNLFLSTWQEARTALIARYPSRAIEVKGFGWHQGENDRFSAEATAEYEANLADLIVDLRNALNAPGMPVVIATTSDGPVPTPPSLWLDIENAQLAMSTRENVTTISTRPNYRLPAVSPREEDIHWNKNAESVYKNGELMGEAMVALLSTPDTPDTTPPSPSPLAFATPPTATNSATITMTANTATDINGVQYRFVETSGYPGATSSDWQYSRTHVDTGLTPGLTYSYTVQARDQSVANNTSVPQAALSASTFPVDTTPPAPNPMTFATTPAAANAITINMTATTAVDANYPVEYFFEETTNNPGGTDSGWQSSPVFSDTGVKPSTTYSYRVKARDKEATPNETGWSAVRSATTPSVPAGTIVWSAPADISGPSDVSTIGTLVSSHTGHNAGGDVTVNGVVFAQGRIPNAQNSGGDIGSRVPSTGSTSYDTFLRSISWNFTGGKVTFTGLTSGASYEIQIWAADNVNTPTGMTSIVLNQGTLYAVNLVHEPLSGAAGQFTTGTFTASGNTQEFNLATYHYYGTPSQAEGGAAITNGLQLRLLSGGAPDTTVPSPNPSSWATPPASSGSSSISMTATTASDVSGVEYFFDETSGNPGGSDSAWQDSASYIDAGLTAGTSYTYTVRSRDKSPAKNLTTASSPASATPQATANALYSLNLWITGKGAPSVWVDPNAAIQATNRATLTIENGETAGVWDTASWQNIDLASVPTGGASITGSPTAKFKIIQAQSRSPYRWAVLRDGNSSVTAGNQAYMNNGNATLLDCRLFGTDNNTDAVIEVSGLTLPVYDVIIYLSMSAEGGQYGSGATLGKGFIDFNNTGLTSWFIAPTPPTAPPGTLTEIVDDGGIGNYVRYRNVTGSSFTARSYGAGTNSAGFAGLQILEVTPPNDYATWAAIYAPANLSDPNADYDGDRMTNDDERAFGLNPTSGGSADPITVPLDITSGTFSYTRRNPALTNLTYTVWTSTTLGGWVKDDNAEPTPGTPDANGIQTVAVKLGPGLLLNPQLFVRVSASPVIP